MSKTKHKSELSRFYLRVLQRKTPLLGFTVLQLAILCLVISAGVSAIIMTRQQSSQAPSTTGSSQSGYSTNGKKHTNTNTGTPSQQNTPQQPTGTQPTATSGNQSDCKRTEIPYKTTYQNVSYLQKGQTKDSSSGMNGFIHDCGDGEPIIVKPVDKTVYVGTGLTDEEIEQQKVEAQQEYDIKYSQWFATYNNAYQTCINSLPSSYQLKDSFCKGQASQQAGPPPQQP